MKHFLLLLLILPTFFILGQESDSTQRPKLVIEQINGPTPWTNLNLNNDSDKFQFAIVTDRTGGHRPGVFVDGVNKLNLLQPEFVMSIGDLIEGYTEDLGELNRQWDEFDGFVKQLEMPFFYLAGNHDITNMVMEKLWQKRLGKTYYHFVYKEVLFLCLNSEDQKRGAGRGSISDQQFNYAKETLEKNDKVKWTLVFMHQPLWHQTDAKRWEDLEALLSKRKHTVFVGHEHSYVKEKRNNGKYFVLATTGGASGLRGPQFGEFDHVVWVTMTKMGPVLANLHLDGIWDENVALPETKNYINKISKKSPFEIKPIFIQQNKFNKGAVAIKITNDENIPMRVRFKEMFSWDLIGELEKVELSIPPNSVETLSLNLRSRKKAFKRPVKIKAFVSYNFNDNNTRIEIPFVFNIKPLKTLALKKAENKIVIDGNPNDWNKLEYKWHTGNKETSVQFSLRYDEKYLYVGVIVEDDSLITFGNGSAWTQDAVRFVINADPVNKSVMSVGKDWYKYEFTQQITPSKGNIKSVSEGKLTNNDQIKCVAIDGAYFVEMAYPLENIKLKQGEDWKSIRFNMSVTDFDGGDTEEFFWMPDWRGGENILGSGIFFRQE